MTLSFTFRRTSAHPAGSSKLKVTPDAGAPERGGNGSILAPPGRKDRRKPSAAHWAPADLPAEQDAGFAIRAAAKQLSYRPASHEPHVRSALWQVRQNRFHKDRFRCGGTRARAKRVRGGLNVGCSSHSSCQRDRGIDFAGPLRPEGCASPVGRAGRSGARARRPRSCLYCPSVSPGSQTQPQGRPLMRSLVLLLSKARPTTRRLKPSATYWA